MTKPRLQLGILSSRFGTGISRCTDLTELEPPFWANIFNLQFPPGGVAMKTRTMMMWVMLVFAVGCDQQAANQALDEAKAAEANARMAEANANQLASAAEPALHNGQSDLDANSESEVDLDANQVLAGAIALAKADNKALFVHFSADW